jgi:hypothetical protein
LRSLVTLGVLLGLLLGISMSGVQAQERQGLDLARRLECFACHALHGQGGNLAVPLDGIGARLSPQTLGTALAQPRRLHPRAKMPSYAYLPLEEQAALVHFLAGLK